MLVRLHANSATIPKMPACTQASGRPVAGLAGELGIRETTVRRWRRRRTVSDRSSMPHRLATGFSAEEETIAVELTIKIADRAPGFSS